MHPTSWTASAFVFVGVAVSALALDAYGLVALGHAPEMTKYMLTLAFPFYFMKNGNGSSGGGPRVSGEVS